jgi:maleamate amidohydrolase
MKRAFEDHCWKDVVPPETLEIYKSYERNLFVGEKPALLLVDLYNSAFEGGARPVMDLLKEYPASCGEYAWNAIKPTLSLIDAARQAGIPVVHVTVDTRPQTDIPGGKASHRRRATISATTFELKTEFQPQTGDLVVYKKRASGFYGTPLASHLNRMEVKSLIVAGETTSGCVRATVADAYSCGFHTVVAEECCFDRAALPHKMNLFDMHHKYADVMHLDDILAELAGRRAQAA